MTDDKKSRIQVLIRLARPIACRGEADRQSDDQPGRFYRNERANHIESDRHKLGRFLTTECSSQLRSGSGSWPLTAITASEPHVDMISLGP